MSVKLYLPPDLDELLDWPTHAVDVCGILAHVPLVVFRCFAHLLEMPPVKGIFRVNGSVKRMRDLDPAYANFDLWLTTASPHDVSGVLKKYTRDYLAALGGLFSQPLLASLLRTYTRRCSVVSSNSFRSAATTVSSEAASEQDPRLLMESIAALLVTKSAARKNALFLYYLSMLNTVALLEADTLMTPANLAIIFQPYLFDTAVVAELPQLQNLLEFLMVNYAEFAEKYATTLALLGGLDEDDVESLVFSDSPNASPLTEYPPSHASPRADRRPSVSRRISSFWDTYNAPANKLKRFSFLSRGSMKSLDQLLKDEHLVPFAPLMNPDSSEEKIHSFSTDELPQLDAEAPPVERAEALPRHKSKRMSFIALFRSLSSQVSIADSAEDQLTPCGSNLSPQTPPSQGVPLNASLDDLLSGEPHASVALPLRKMSFGRKLSLRMARK